MFIQYNMTNSNVVGDLTTFQQVATGSQDFTIKLTPKTSASVQVVYDTTDANDDTFELEVSEDGTNFSTYPGAATITTTISVPPVTGGWFTSDFTHAYLRVKFTKGSSTTGRYFIILTCKTED